MKNIDSYLDYVESVAHNFLDAKSRAPICSEIESIRQKNADPYLYLAVVGEFSSGKSTFINALAGERLLKDAVMPTTASATYIRRRGDVRAIEVQFNSGRRMRATENDWNALSTYLSRMCGVRSSSFRELIHALTSDSKAAVHVARLDIDLPEAPLPPNIVVIDTPGFNPGNDNGGDHLGITSRVVGQVADLAIILTPQEQAMSASLSAFVAEKLGRFLHRCTFVVTKIDNQYIPQQRADTLLYVRGRIAADLGLDDAPLYALSSVAVLPGIMVPQGREDEFKALRADFAAFRSQTWKRIEQKHHIVLAEHVLTLLDRTLAGCKESLANRRKELEKEQEFLREHQIESVAVVTRSMAKKAIDAINGRLSEINRFDAAFDAAAARAIGK
ncbi:MAG: dynamin family protein, partial [Muribaculaceae bacterium]|nr:dynamin family protein [Muribaculaceae bacterium]